VFVKLDAADQDPDAGGGRRQRDADFFRLAPLLRVRIVAAVLRRRRALRRVVTNPVRVRDLPRGAELARRGVDGAEVAPVARVAGRAGHGQRTREKVGGHVDDRALEFPVLRRVALPDFAARAGQIDHVEIVKRAAVEGG